MRTAKDLGAKLNELSAAHDKAAAAVNAIVALRVKVETLQRASVSGDTLEECEAAARELIKASEDLRLAEIIAPAKERSATEAKQAAIREAGRVVRAIGTDFSKLHEDAFSVAMLIVRRFVAPEIAGLSQYEPEGMLRERTLASMAGHFPGSVPAAIQARRADDIRTNTTMAVVSEAQAMLETFDEDNARIRGEIDQLKTILRTIGGEVEQAEAGPVSPASADTAAELEPALAG